MTQVPRMPASGSIETEPNFQRRARVPRLRPPLDAPDTGDELRLDPEGMPPWGDHRIGATMPKPSRAIGAPLGGSSLLASQKPMVHHQIILDAAERKDLTCSSSSLLWLCPSSSCSWRSSDPTWWNRSSGSRRSVQRLVKPKACHNLTEHGPAVSPTSPSIRYDHELGCSEYLVRNSSCFPFLSREKYVTIKHRFER